MQPDEDRGLLRFTTCGSVDDGKSTLIGRLLFDTRSILVDTLSAIERTSQKRGLNAVDLSLLTDGLQSEREQGITIDVAYRYFSTGTRKYIIADAPGHEQYTRNMVTAASTAHLAIILVDARKGVLPQTRRHSFITRLMGIRHVVVAVNKMDLVGHDRAAFERIRDDYAAFAAGAGITDVRYIPMSALQGSMVVDRGDELGWYEGPTLLDVLEAADADDGGGDARFRLPVQYVCRVHDEGLGAAMHDDAARVGAGYRGFMGRITGGEVSVGDRVVVLPAGREARVRAVQLLGQDLSKGVAGQSVTVVLDDEVDVSRGDLIAKVDEAPAPRKQVEAMLCWLSETPMDRARKYLVRHTTRETKAAVASIDWRLDIHSAAQQPASSLQMNDIARVTLKLAQPLLCDPYAENRATGAFIVIDESTNNTVGAGMIV
ncbi:MAG: GTP-binding protein [Polyangiales bacterium]